MVFGVFLGNGQPMGEGHVSGSKTRDPLALKCIHLNFVGATPGRSALFPGLVRLFRRLRGRTLRRARNKEIVQLLAGLERGSEPTGLQTTASPGFLRVLGIAVFWSDRPFWTASN